METYTDSPYYTFAEETTDALLDKEGYLVMPGTAQGTIKLATSAAVAIGVLFEKRKGSPHANVRLLGKGGTVKVRAGGVIAKGSLVTWGTGGKFVTAASGNTLGTKLTQGSSADNDIIEIVDQFRTT